MYCDLHTHSVFSDGTCTPSAVVVQAEQLGLAAVALTDHNTVAGLPAFLQAAEGKNVMAVPGMELSVQYGQGEVHMLGLFLPRTSWPILQNKMEEVNRRKEESNRELIAALQKAGYPLDYDELTAATPTGRINRAHMGADLIKKGYVNSIGEAMNGLLSEKGGYYRPPKRMDAMEAVALIRQLGGAPVLAHPFLNLTEDKLMAFLPQAKEAGMMGMETHYSLFTAEETERARQLAERFGLMESGGSDFHGHHKPDIALGWGRGNLRIPAAFYERLSTAAQQK